MFKRVKKTYEMPTVLNLLSRNERNIVIKFLNKLILIIWPKIVGFLNALTIIYFLVQYNKY